MPGTATRAALSALALALAGSGPGLVGCARPSRPAAALPSGNTLVVGLGAEPDSLNVYLARQAEALLLANRVLPRLWREVLPGDAAPAGLEPELVVGQPAWEDGGRIARIELRSDARWSSGTPVGCADVRATWQAQVDPALGWRAASIKRHIEAVECAGATTLIVRFDHPYPEALTDLNDLHILPAALAARPRAGWRTLDWAALLPAAGPFAVERVVPGQELALARNPAYWGGPRTPRIDRIVFRIVPDTSSRLAQFLAGELDVVENVPASAARRLATDPRTVLVRRPGWGYTYAGWSTIEPAAYAEYRARRRAACGDCPDDAEAVARLARTRPHPLFGDARVRRALTLAIDRQGIVDALLGGEGEVPASPILAPLPEHDPRLAPLPHDRAAARALLREAGFADADGDGTLERGGRRLAFELAVQAGNRLRRDIAALVERDLAAVGAAVTIRPVEDSSWYAHLGARQADAWIGAWRVSARVDMTEMLHAAACGQGGMNFGAWSHAVADRVALEARDAVDPAARAALWRRWEAVFAAEQPYTLLAREARLVAVRTRVTGAGSLLANDVLNGVEEWSLAE